MRLLLILRPRRPSQTALAPTAEEAAAAAAEEEEEEEEEEELSLEAMALDSGDAPARALVI